MSLQKSKIQWELMLPTEFRAAMKALPVCFMPLDTVEWHGEHNALGLDSLKAQALCIRAAEKAGGGINAIEASFSVHQPAGGVVVDASGYGVSHRGLDPYGYKCSDFVNHVHRASRT